MNRIEFTLEQRKALEPLLNLVRQSNLNGQGGAIVAQVYVDGLVAKFLPHDQAKAVAAALGGDLTHLHSTSASRTAE